jgi:hypothetical protein
VLLEDASLECVGVQQGKGSERADGVDRLRRKMDVTERGIQLG